MGGRSGSVPVASRGGMNPGDGTFRGKITNIESLKNIQDPQLYKEIKSAISRFYAAMGLTQRNVKLADFPDKYAGVHVTVNGKSDGVYLNKKWFKNGTKQSITNSKRKAYEAGWATKTNKPVAHTITHELAHSVWNHHMTGSKQLAAGKEITSVYNRWLRDKKKSTDYGKYARSNVSEFYAETITKAIHGKSDKYTRALKSISKKYNL